MATIVTRETGATAKGSPLTNAEVDNNFINLNTDLTKVVSNGSYNLYTSSNADNYLAGKLLIGGTNTASGPVYVVDTGLGRDIACESNTANAFAFRHTFFKSRGSNSAKTIVSAGDELGLLNFYGYDGTAYVGAAAIRAYVDTTPAAGDMPGKLSFFTTKDGTSTLTEALTIDSLQRFQFNGTIGIGAVPGGDTGIKLSINATGATTTYGFRNIQTLQSDVTTTAHQFISNPSTAAAAFTLTNLNHYSIIQGTIGSGSAVTTQRGFFVNQTFTGATNNYAFVSDLAAGTGRYNLYMAGTADNWFNGSLTVNGANYVARNASGEAATVRGIRFDIDGTTYGRVWCPNGQSLAIQAGSGTLTDAVTVSQTGTVGIGANPVAGVSFLNAKTISGASSSYSNWTSATVDSTVTNAFVNSTNIGKQATAFTLSGLYHYRSSQGSFGAGSTVTTQYGHYADASLTGATNNYGFYGAIASGTGRYNLYMNGTAANYLAGKLGIGTLPFSDTSGISVGSTLTGGTTQNAVNVYTTASSDVTNSARGYISAIGTTAAAFTLGSIQHFSANQLTIGAGSTASAQYGFIANNSLTGAVNNYGFYGVIASGTGRYNLYMAGTADNYLAGNLGVGTTSLTATTVAIGKAMTGATQAYGITQIGVVQSDVTGGGNYFSTNASTLAASFTLNNMRHYFATQGTIGAGSTVNNQYGFIADATLTGAINDYGFYGAIAAGTGRYNLYMNGTADNYLAGKLQVDNYLLINYGSTQYSGMSIRNIYGNATRKGTSFLDFQNESAIATGHIFCNHEADGSSTFILGNTPPGAKTSDRRRECLLIDGHRNLKLMGATTGTSAVNVLAMPNGTAPTTSPTGVGQIYIEAGALKYRGASGTVTTLAPA
jgi:hypothetical protein